MDDHNVESKIVQTNSIVHHNRTVQCCEGEDDTEFLSALESCRRGNKVRTLRAKDYRKTEVLNFIVKYSNAMESILAADKDRSLLQNGKAITVSFGKSNVNDKIQVNQVLKKSKLIFIDCFHKEVCIFLSCLILSSFNRYRTNLSDTLSLQFCLQCTM